ERRGRRPHGAQSRRGSDGAAGGRDDARRLAHRRPAGHPARGDRAPLRRGDRARGRGAGRQRRLDHRPLPGRGSTARGVAARGRGDRSGGAVGRRVRPRPPRTVRM
ncbi:MAG: hypothetical protein AVDCRST_MAG57-2346, partial [uncultured Blastococcus sp.]